MILRWMKAMSYFLKSGILKLKNIQEEVLKKSDLCRKI